MGFLTASNPSGRDQIQFLWRGEAAWMPLWSLGFVSDLGLPLEQISPGDAVDILEEHGVQGLAVNPHLPSMEEVSASGKDGPSLHVDVTPDRQHALN